LIYICIPTHNEQQTVGVVLWKLRQVLTEYPRDYQLLVADDASTDRTQDVLEPYTRVLPLTVIRSDTRHGNAASLEMLLREAARRSEYPKRDVIVTLQADFSEEPDDVVALLKQLEAGADVAVGSKVAAQKQPFARRFARRLSGFFARGQQWPEGVSEPFDSYRAYRLYAVKRAIEEREGRRLLRYDGWAAHAELLRAVLPHARRVEVVEVEDRSDRKQRPSRERPFAAALQVRAMMNEADPGDLVPVVELDRLAATASRTRDRTAANGNGRRLQNTAGNGGRDTRSRERGRSGGRGEGRREEPRSRSTGETPRGSDARRGAGEARRSAAKSSRPPREGRPPRAERSEGAEERPPRSRPPRQREAPTPPVQQGAGPAIEAELDPTLLPGAAELPGDAGVGEGEGTDDAPRKRRRRRRGRGGSKRAAGQAPEAAEDTETPVGTASDGSSSADEGSDPDGDEQPEGERKRRRRGGRRGGRGRRKRQPGEAAAEGEAGAEGSAGAEGAEGQAPNGTAQGGVEPMAGANAAPPPERRPDEE
jgi:hypothetical protein